MERKSTTSSAAKSAQSTDSKPFLRMGRGSVAPPAPPQDTYAFDCGRRMRGFSFLFFPQVQRLLESLPLHSATKYPLIHKITAVSPSSPVSLVRKDRSSHIVRRHALQKPSASARVRGGGGGGGPPAPPPVPTPIETRNGVSSRKLRFPVSYSFSIIIGGGAARFTVKQNSLPSPTLLVTQIFSPICSSISRAMDSPRPEPMPLCALSTL